MNIAQKNVSRDDLYISSKDPIDNSVTLKGTDADYIKRAPTVLTYWFIDCTYYGYTDNLTFQFNFPVAEKKHHIEALVVADFTPLPPPTTTTIAPPTTFKPNTTTIPPKTTTAPSNITTTSTKPTTITTTKPTVVTTTPSNSKTIKPNNVTSAVDTAQKSVLASEGSLKAFRNKRDTQVESVNNSTKLKMMVNGTIKKYDDHFGEFPYVCNGSRIAADVNKTYGYFSRTVIVKGKLVLLL